MNHQSQEIQFLELAEHIEDTLKQAHELVSELSVYCLERKCIRQMDRNGVDSWRARRTLAELTQERERLTSRN
jgi:hypothetical protein